MRFTENELTRALEGAAKTVLASQKEVRKAGGDGEAAWAALSKFQRWQLLDSLGDQILPVMIALPDAEVEVGERPTYTDAQVRAVVEERLDPGEGRLRRAALVAARTALVQTALAAVPPRQDPDAFVVPDHL